MTAQTPCLGINTPVPASFPAREIAGQTFVDIPATSFVMGSAAYEDATPHWVGLSPYAIATTPVTVASYFADVEKPSTH